MSSLVSILIPAYNAGEFLEPCLQSALGQSHPDVEVIVIDDGSNDPGSLTRSIESRFAREFPDKMRLFQRENRGVAATRTELLRLAKGDYIIFLDADDWMEPDMIECLLKQIRLTDSDIAVCHATVERPGTPAIQPEAWHPESVEILSHDETMREFLAHRRLNGSLGSKLVKSNLYEGLEFPKDIWYGEDAWVAWGFFQRARRVSISPYAPYHYRMLPSSISHQSFNHKKLSGHKVWQHILRETSANHPQYLPITRATTALADAWLLFFAAQGGYSSRKDLRPLRRTVGAHVLPLLKSPLHSRASKILGLTALLPTPFMRLLTRLHPVNNL